MQIVRARRNNVASSLVVVDSTDRHLLEEIQDDASRPLHQLGEIVGLSAAAVQRRLAKFKRSGLIARTVCLLDNRRAGHPLTVITLITVVNDAPAQTDQLVASLGALPQVQQVHELVGERDFALVTIVANLDDYAATVADLLNLDPNVDRFESHVSLRTHKRSSKISLRDDADSV